MNTTGCPLKQEEREWHQAELIVHCLSTSHRSGEINGRPLVLSENGEIYIDTGDTGRRIEPHCLPYPGKPYEGLAIFTTEDAARIQDWARRLKWVYLDALSYQLKYGVQEDTEGKLAGPFHCIPQNHHLTFQAWEGFCAVETQPNRWAIYFDLSDNGLKEKVPLSAKIVKIELERRGPENASALPCQTGLFTTKVEELCDQFEEGSTFSTCDETGQDHAVGTAISIMCTRIERTERHVKEEFLITIPGPPIEGPGLATAPIVLETWYDDLIETEATEHFCPENIYHNFESDLTPIAEEGFIETPTPSPEDIDRLEADVIAMLELRPTNPEASKSLASDASTDTTSKVSLRTNTFSAPGTTTKPLPPLPTDCVSTGSSALRIVTPEHRQHTCKHRPDSAIAFVQSPTIYPGSSPWDTSRAHRKSIAGRPSMMNLDADELAAIEDLSRSLDFGDRPVLSLSAYTNVWGEAQKEPRLSFVKRMNDGSKRMLRGLKNVGPRLFRVRHRKSGASCEGHEEGRAASRKRRHSGT